MGLFDFFKKGTAKPASPVTTGAYPDHATNHIYELLFCDNLELYKANMTTPYIYPYDILFSDNVSTAALESITVDTTLESRLKLLAFRRLANMGAIAGPKELLGVIVEVGLDMGLDTLASFRDGRARYINQSGEIVVWETTSDAEANALTSDLFTKSEDVVSKIGPWDKPRLRHPAYGKTRISFLVADGLYFGEAPTDILFKDEMAAPALMAATRLMQFLTHQSLQELKS